MYVEPAFPVRLFNGIAAKWSRSAPPVRVMPPVEVEDEHPVIQALKRAGRPLTNQELSRFLNCSEGQATKLRRKVKSRLIEWRQGRYVFVAIADFREFPIVSSRKLNGNWRQS